MVRSGTLSADARRAVTVEAVLDLAGEKIPSDITTSEIASHMKLTQGALFRHFPSKNAIWEAVMDWVADHLIGRIDQAAADGGALSIARLEAVFMAHVGFVVERPGVPRLMFGELQRTEDTVAKRIARTLIKQYAARLASIIEEGKSSGELRAELDTRAATTLFIGTIQGLVMQSMLTGSLGRIRREAPGVFEIYRCGLIRTDTTRSNK